MTRPGHVSLGACDVFCDNIAPEKREMTRGGGLGSRPKKNVRGEIGGWGRVPFNETYAPSLSTIYDGA